MRSSYRYRPDAAGAIAVSESRGAASDVLLASDVSADRTSRCQPEQLCDTTIVQQPAAAGADSAAAVSPPTLPGFTDLSLLGRGGMGLVYRARQVSLGRDVAIKVLSSAGQADAEQRLRLQWEAEAAARLQHPNIVQIFEIGHYEALDYLVLELVEGGTLKRFVAGQPQPVRDAAELIETLARAVHQAHFSGIVHRDLKPDNVLLTADRVPKISDFGLAHRLHAEHDPLTGSVVGTAYYMAPEQAAGNASQHPIGPAADIYSLGIILYELLAGQLPFTGQDLVTILRRVCSDAPRPLRQLRRDVPLDLEAITLKCLAKDPGERYGSAEALAIDLRRFLEGEPVAARPLHRPARLMKWARRRPLHAALLTVSVAAAVALVGGGAWYQARLTAALAEARANLQSVQDAVDGLLGDLSGGGLSFLPHSEPLQQQMLSRALTVCQRLVAQYPHDPAVRFQTAKAQRQLADLEQLLGHTAPSRDAYRLAVDLSQALLAAQPGQTRYLRELAVALNNRGNLAENDGQGDAALSDYQQSNSLWGQLVAQDGNDADFLAGLAASCSNLGRARMAAGQFAQAQEAFDEALSLGRRLTARQESPSARPGLLLALAGNNLGTLLQARGRYVAALVEFGSALDALGELAADEQRSPHARLLSGCLHHNLAIIAVANDTGAEQEFALAIAQLRALHADFPRIERVQLELADTLCDAALAEGEAKASESGFETAFRLNARAVELLHEAASLYEPLASGPHTLPQAVSGRSLCLERLGLDLLAQANRQDGLRNLEQAQQLAEGLVARYPNEPAFKNRLAGVLAAQASWLAGSGNLSGAQRRLRLAAQLQSEALAAVPEHVAFGQQLTGHYQSLAKVSIELGDLAGAAAAADSLMRLPQSPPGTTLRAGRILAHCVSLAAMLKGDLTLDGPERLPADEWARQSVAALAEAVRQGAIDPRDLQKDEELAPLRQRPDFQGLVAPAAEQPSSH